MYAHGRYPQEIKQVMQSSTVVIGKIEMIYLVERVKASLGFCNRRQVLFRKILL